jgi:hypothetical protein
MNQIPARILFYVTVTGGLTLVSIYVNESTAFRYKWWNLLCLIAVILTVRWLFYQAFSAEEKRWIKASNVITPLTWMLVLITICVLMSVFAG